MANPLDSLPPDVADAWRSGRKIDAIRLLREKSGAGLAEAKATIDALERAEGKAPELKVKGALPEVISALASLGAVPPEIADAWRRGDKAAALKWLREHSRAGAAAAKMQADHGDAASVGVAKAAGEKITSLASARDGLSPGEVPRAKGESWLLVVLAVVLLGLWAWFKLA